jgi:hypothetical protein
LAGPNLHIFPQVSSGPTVHHGSFGTGAIFVRSWARLCFDISVSFINVRVRMVTFIPALNIVSCDDPFSLTCRFHRIASVNPQTWHVGPSPWLARHTNRDGRYRMVLVSFRVMALVVDIRTWGGGSVPPARWPVIPMTTRHWRVLWMVLLLLLLSLMIVRLRRKISGCFRRRRQPPNKTSRNCSNRTTTTGTIMTLYWAILLVVVVLLHKLCNAHWQVDILHLIVVVTTS